MANSRIASLVLGVLLSCAYAWTQESQTSSQTPVAVAPSYGDNMPLASSSALNSDNRPPSGIQPVGLGFGGKKELNVDLNGIESWQNNAPGAPANTWSSVPSFGGSLGLNFGTEKSQTLLNYSGSVIHYSYLSQDWTTYQNISFSQSVRIGRWTVTGVDAFHYSPNSPFGSYEYGPSAAITTANATGTLNPQYVPNQTIITPTTASYFNTASGQLEYGISRRSSWTFSGSYGILGFPDSGFNNTNQVVASTGYNHALTAKDKISATYTYSDFHYSGLGSSFTTQMVQLGYSRQVNGRLALQVSAGPELVDAPSIGLAQKQVQLSAHAGLTYSRAKTSLGLTYFRGTTAGSGVLTGASTDSGTFSVAHEFSRQWHTGTAIGYSRNGGLVQQGLAGKSVYDTLYVTPSIRRALTRNLGASFNYSYQRQLTSNCVGSTCGNVSWSVLSAGLDYKFRPIRLE